MFDELDFNEENHVYRLNGVIIPSVSKIIEPISMATYGSVDPVVLQNAANRGTAVHKAIEWYNDIGVMDIQSDLMGYGDAYVQWFKKHNPEIRHSEFRVYHKLMRYAGTVDCLAMVGGELWLIDYKTSYKVVDKNYRLQLEAYSQALQSQGIFVQAKMVLHLTKDGRYEEIFYPTKDAEAWRVFGACKTIYDYNNI